MTQITHPNTNRSAKKHKGKIDINTVDIELVAKFARTMGLHYNVYLDAHRIYGCKNCKTHLSCHDDIISRVRVLLLTLH